MTAKASVTSVRSLDDVPSYGAAAEKLNTLEGQRRELAADVERIEMEFRQLPKGKEKLTRDAQRFLETGTIGPDSPAAASELGEARRRLEVMTAALDLQRALVGRELAKASQAICQALAPQHRQLVANIALRPSPCLTMC